jgi:polyhydroxybutyrate depolymerase
MKWCLPPGAATRAMPRLWPAAAGLAAAALALTACGAPAAPAAPAARTASARTTTHEIHVGPRTRSYVQISPLRPGAGPVPVIVMLSGIHAPVGTEMARDGLLGLASTGRAELIYPVGVNKSWNAIGCCGTANREHVDDVGFLRALAPRLDPGRTRPIYLAGYSNGGRLVYRVLCTDPGLFTGYEVIKAMPEPGCVVSKPVSILQIDSTDDRGVPLKPGEHGRESPPATTEMARLRRVGDCRASATSGKGGPVQVTTWTRCRQGTRITFAVYQGGGHSWPTGGGGTTPAATLMSDFAGAAGSGQHSAGQHSTAATAGQRGGTSAGHQGSGPAASK